ncbi:hypothetical protein BCR32DRAFT_282574 [Anaeromyces robustus]|uniref:Uncharacterized protein n=1 Tax=Anaeromyces robustus TaxID=1754192 RepID=A0A1Y1WX71_9FUNG|nr:hypothetical protein BCR32DRAFT_282574 [Anaeromyces robustus]|eukprot:ORX78113.1 hypothetical protein BCR32DRAFT_282574 [Anaeromyces robustus]
MKIISYLLKVTISPTTVIFHRNGFLHCGKVVISAFNYWAVFLVTTVRMWGL